MAVSIDNVYQKVLALANKEQRGYITPQEFNLLADKAQNDIFENYFNELDSFRKKPGNDTVYADEIDSIQEKINVHEKFFQFVTMSTGGSGALPTYHKMGKLSHHNSAQEIQVNGAVSSAANIVFDSTVAALGLAIGDEVYLTASGALLGSITVLETGSNANTITISASTSITDDHYVTVMPNRNNSGYKEVQLVSQNKLNHYTNSSKLSPTTKYPVYVKTSDTTIQVYPTSISTGVVCNYVAKPAKPNWTYVVINGKALYNASGSGRTDFELHASEESTLVNKILELAGIVVNKPGLSEVILRNEAMKEAIENK
tara:strand:- start:3647 stop:4591 length:945 start_codon:yes stop_codon:yes gene_type:complete